MTMYYYLLFFLLLLHPPQPTFSIDNRDECFSKKHPFTESCLKFCESKRPETTNGEFHADCGNPNPNEPYNEARFQCRWACAEHQCPCHKCPDGNYVKCPANLDSPGRPVGRLSTHLAPDYKYVNSAGSSTDQKREREEETNKKKKEIDPVPWWAWLLVVMFILAVFVLPVLIAGIIIYRRKRAEARAAEAAMASDSLPPPDPNSSSVPSVHFSENSDRQK